MMQTTGIEAEPWFGWADRLALLIDAHQKTVEPGHRLEYANLAVRGRRVEHVVDDQIPAAIRMRADLVSVLIGGNDLMSFRVDPAALAARLEAGIAALRTAGIEVLLATGFDPRHTPYRFLRAFRGRAAAFSDAVAEIGRRHGCIALDLWGITDFREASHWSADRIHPSTRGHLVLTAAAAGALGIPGSAEPGELPPAQRPLPTTVWMRRHMLPWVGRRLRGVSSGDGRAPKAPEPRPVGARA